jgi:isocitrate dehydrogenase (NAD+)
MSSQNENIQTALKHFEMILTEQLERIEQMKQDTEWTNFAELNPIIIGVCPGDGIGPSICKSAETILRYFLKDQIESKKIEIRMIDGLTIENRAKVLKAIPDDVLEELKACHVILKGPTTTPQKGDQWPNIESANVSMRRALDLFANIRPVAIPSDNIDWMFFRENTEGAYVLGSKGINVSEDLSIDFKVITEQGAERLIKAAFEYAKKNNKKKVTIVTKSNVVKTTDGRFSEVGKKIAKDYPDIECDEWYVDIITAKLVDPARRSTFQVFALPNLYGDIVTDLAAQIQGGVGTAGSANIGKKWSMFEAIHGSAPRMVKEGRAQFADPSSMIKAAALLMNHIGYVKEAQKLEYALDICANYEKKIKMTGRDTGATGDEYTKYIIKWIQNPELKSSWEKYQK